MLHPFLPLCLSFFSAFRMFHLKNGVFIVQIYLFSGEVPYSGLSDDSISCLRRYVKGI